MGLHDTGTDNCCIEQQAFGKIPKHLKPKLLNTKPGIFKAANGGLLQTHGRYLITIQIENRKLTHLYVLVKEMGVDMII